MAAPSYVTSPQREERQRYETLRNTLKTARSSFDADWRELADFFMPRRSRFQVSDQNRGGRRNQNIIDSTGTFAVRTLQSGLHAGLTSPARPWLRLTTPDPDLAEFGPVKQWLHLVTQRMRVVFQQTNLYNALPVVYGDMGMFATACLSVIEDDEDLFVCEVFPIGSYGVSRDNKGRVAAFYHDRQYSVAALVETFGGPHGQTREPGQEPDWDRFSRSVKDLWTKGDRETPIEVTWFVVKNPHPDPNRLSPEALPYLSCHVETGCADTGLFLRKAGFHLCPIFAPRWDVTGSDNYGTSCPGMVALGDVKQLQTMSRKEGQAIAKMVDPPLTGPNSLRNQKVSLLPGDVTYDDAREGRAGLRPVHEVKPDLSAFAASKNEVQYRINRAFFADLFLMLAQSDGQRGAQPLTAREIDERHEEKLLALGPVLERTNKELLDPLVDRVYDLMERNGLIPDPPQELDGVKLRVEYTSLMAQAQKLVAVAGLDRFVQTVGSMAAFAPEVLDKVKFTDVVDEYQEALGVSPRLVRTDDETQAMGQARAQAAQQAQMAEQMAMAAKGARDLGATPMDGDTALSRLVEATA